MGKNFKHYVAFITARITIESPDGKNSSIGTGFYYDAPLNDGTDRSITLLISNKHVYSNPKGKLSICLNQKINNDTPKYGDIITFNYTDFSNNYYSHPDNDVDLACVNVSNISHQDAFYKTLHQDFMKPINYDEVLPSHQVIFVGYPKNRYDTVNNLPLIRQGTIASLPDIDFNGKGQIVIDAQVFQGSSGSPVFIISEGHYSLLGVVSQTMIQHSRLQTIPAISTSTVGVEQILGLGIVIKQRHVHELITHTINEFILQEKSKV